jgi:hypothetical protein
MQWMFTSDNCSEIKKKWILGYYVNNCLNRFISKKGSNENSIDMLHKNMMFIWKWVKRVSCEYKNSYKR